LVRVIGPPARSQDGHIWPWGGKLASISVEESVASEEITAERLDRELNELLQELRVEQNGILLLVGFLLVIPFSARFAHVSRFERDVYYLTLLSAGLASVVIIAPVAYHRIVFRKRAKDVLVHRGHMLAAAGLVLLSVTILGVLILVTNFLFGTALTVAMSVVYVAVVSTLWLFMPMQSRRAASAATEPRAGQPAKVAAPVSK
jgi:Family of unknown function (DUF6328)